MIVCLCCVKDENQLIHINLTVHECITKSLERNGMKPYDQQLVDGCDFYLVMYEYNDQLFFSLNSNCADMLPNIQNCDGIEICSTDPKLCNEVYASGSGKIVGIKK